MIAFIVSPLGPSTHVVLCVRSPVVVFPLHVWSGNGGVAVVVVMLVVICVGAAARPVGMME